MKHIFKTTLLLTATLLVGHAAQSDTLPPGANTANNQGAAALLELLYLSAASARAGSRESGNVTTERNDSSRIPANVQMEPAALKVDAQQH